MEEASVVLDDVVLLHARDPGGMLETTYRLAEQVEESRSIVDRLPTLPAWSFRQVLFCGTGGGSRAAFDLLASTLVDRFPHPFAIYQGYDLPGFVDDRTLVFLCSHSGDTEEAISSLKAALERTRMIITLSGGGEMEAIACSRGLYHAKVPLGMEARCALGYLYFTTLGLLERIFHWPTHFTPEVWGNLRLEREQLRPETPLASNPAKQAALRMMDRLPLLYGFTGFSDALAGRLRRQLAENGKKLAHDNTIPPMHHDEIVGYEDIAWREQLLPVFLRDFEEDERIAKRFAVTREVLEERGFPVLELFPLNRGSKVSRLWSAVQLIDYISLYVALARGFNPRDVAIIRLFKEKMRI